MAEKAAHHTTTIVSRPSIFEVIAQENLSSTIYPALKKIFYVSSIDIIINCIFNCISYFTSKLCLVYYS